MAFQFPASPVLGQIFEPTPGTSYKWNGTGWSPYSTLFPGGGTFTGPVLHADGTVSAPGISWANEPNSGWYRAGTNDIRLGLGGAVRMQHTTASTWFAGGISALSNGNLVVPGNATANTLWAGDGTAGAPGMSWASEPSSGFVRQSGQSFQYITAAFPTFSYFGSTGFYEFNRILDSSIALQIQGGRFHTVPGITLASIRVPGGEKMAGIDMRILGTSPPKAAIVFTIARGTYASSGIDDFVMGINNSDQPQFAINGGFSGVFADIPYAPFVVRSPAGQVAGLTLQRTGTVTWAMLTHPNNCLAFAESTGVGPSSLGGFAVMFDKLGQVYGKGFTVQTLLATNIVPMTGALSDVLKLRGVRCLNTETNLPDIRLEVDDIELAFPELVSAVGEGKGINYMALAAPIIEAIRELDTRTREYDASIPNLIARVDEHDASMPKLMEHVLELDARTRSPLGSAPASDVNQLTGALSRVLKLRGVRFQNLDTGQSDIRLDDLALEYPELAASDSRLTAPIVEALRELNDRLTALERQ